MAQIIRITSEALQATIRRLLPSQQGFGEDLQASNVIQPIIDLTPTAEGSALDTDLARAINFGDATTFNAQATSPTLANTPGFYRVIAGFCVQVPAATAGTLKLTMSNSLTTKDVWQINADNNSGTPGLSGVIDYIFFLDTGDTLSAESSGNSFRMSGSVRQIADRYGNIVNPAGFTFE